MKITGGYIRVQMHQHKYQLLTPAPSCKPWSFSYFRLLAGYSRSPELDFHTLPHDCIPKHMHRPTAQTLLLTGIPRALGDHQAMADDSRVKIYCSDQSLTHYLKSPPSTHSSEVLDWLHELVHLHTDVSTRYFHQSGVRTFSPGLIPSELEMYISQHYSRTGISPSNLPDSEFSTRESSLALSECLPVDLLRDT